jgi:ABC-type multidrug transport system ATPase subunit
MNRKMFQCCGIKQHTQAVTANRPEIVTKWLTKNMEAIPEKHAIDSLKKTTILGTSHIIQKVSQSKIIILSGGDQCWFRKSARKKMPVTRNNNNDDDNNNNIIIIIISLTTEVQRIWPATTELVPIIIQATGTTSKSFRKCLNIPEKHDIKEIKKTAILSTTRIYFGKY